MLEKRFYGEIYHLGALLSTLQINSYNARALAADRREVTEGFILHNICCNAPILHNAWLRRGCLHKQLLRQKSKTQHFRNSSFYSNKPASLDQWLNSNLLQNIFYLKPNYSYRVHQNSDFSCGFYFPDGLTSNTADYS